MLEGKNKIIKIGTHQLSISNYNKFFWSQIEITKGDLISYYLDFWPYILPFVKDKPQSLHRFPDGYSGKNFYQKNVSRLHLPLWIKTLQVESITEKKTTKYLVCDTCESLIFMINLGCIEVNPWHSKTDSLNYPEWTVIDLDPLETPFNHLIQVALTTHQVLNEAGIRSYCKTSGASGLHIYIPLKQKITYQQSKDFAKHLAVQVHNLLPELTSLERKPAKRKGKVYLDYLQNSMGQTLAAPYSVRPTKEATISTPLAWGEVNENLNTKNFTIKTIKERVKKHHEVWNNFFNSK